MIALWPFLFAVIFYLWIGLGYALFWLARTGKGMENKLEAGLAKSKHKMKIRLYATTMIFMTFMFVWIFWIAVVYFRLVEKKKGVKK